MKALLFTLLLSAAASLLIAHGTMIPPDPWAGSCPAGYQACGTDGTWCCANPICGAKR